MARAPLELRFCLSALCIGILVGRAVCQPSNGPQTPSVIRIDCGSALSSVVNGRVWMPDSYFAGGEAAVVSAVGALQGALNPIEDTLRAFPGPMGGCYNVPVVPWRYLVRLGFAYFNWDGKNNPPTFNVTLQGSAVATMFMVQYETGQQVGPGATYRDFVTPAWKGIVRVCVRPFVSRFSALQSNVSATPLLNSLEILPMDAQAYDEQRTMLNDILATQVRLNLGGPSIGPDPVDPAYRIWQKDTLPVAPGLVIAAPPGVPIAGALSPPDYVPAQIFSSARLASQQAGGAFALQLPVWPMNLAHNYVLRVYVAEVQAGVVHAGERVFDIVVGATMPDGSLVRLNQPAKFDILSVAPPFTAVSLTYALTLQGLPTYSQALVIGVQTLQGSRFPGLMCGLELFEVIPAEEMVQLTPNGPVVVPGAPVPTAPTPAPQPEAKSPSPAHHPPHHPPPIVLPTPSPIMQMAPPAAPLPLMYPPPGFPAPTTAVSNSAPSGSSSDGGGISTGALVAIIIICTVAAAAAIGLVTWLVVRSRNNDDVDDAAASLENSPKPMYITQPMHPAMLQSMPLPPGAHSMPVMQMAHSQPMGGHMQRA